MKGFITTVSVAARRLIVPVAVAIALLIAPAAAVALATTVAPGAEATVSASANDIALSRHGGGIYKHLWLDEIGPRVYVPHVDTSVHQSR